MDWLLETETNNRGDVTFKNQDAIDCAQFQGIRWSVYFKLFSAYRLYQTFRHSQQDENFML
jgi:hypothetical protein